MNDLAALRAADEIPDVLLLLEHAPVFTAGRSSDPAHLKWSEDRIRGLGAELHHVDRGGSLTFHGPGQLVGYPILRLDSRLEIIPHLRRMEEVVIRAGRDLGVPLGRHERRTGVWAGSAKVCAIGVRLSAGRVTTHGFGLNCTTDLGWFAGIVPCGLTDATVTSLSELAGRLVHVDEAADAVMRHTPHVFERRIRPAPPEVAGRFSPEHARVETA
jgi:lipoyl(octanoyl) transferase